MPSWTRWWPCWSRPACSSQTIDEGQPALQLTPKGARVATQMAMSSEDDALAMFNALLDAAESDTSAG